jgi:hypothetical protein
MSTTKNKQEKPNWFTGAWYETGDTVTNPFSGESYELTGPELSMYDFIMGATWTIEQKFQQDVVDPMVNKLQRDLTKGLDWFRSVNPKAYMILLD